jgi:SAM-dependent methyltransferase
MLTVVKRLVPRSVKKSMRSYLTNRDKARLFGDLAPLVPTVDQMFEGPQSLEQFKINGDEFLQIYKELCRLGPVEKMLDVGCGIGRKTLPLTRYLSPESVYEGIDITKAGIDWCRDKITPRFPNFHFQHIDVYNKNYNPGGKYRPSDFTFPFADNTFTFVALGSVFTHMLPDGVANYLSEIQRVMVKGGRCLITYFLLNENSLRHIESGESTLDLRYVFDRYRTVSREVPEQAIALDEGWVRSLYAKLRLKISHLQHGSWSRVHGVSIGYQDLVLAEKA